MSLVHQVPVVGPATHAIIIGVGRYPWLPGGGEPTLPGLTGIGQLTSPPKSARALAEWLIKGFKNDERPLASVRLLLSEGVPEAFINPQTKQSYVFEGAGMDAIAADVKGWREDAGKDDGSLALFAFCGHGMGSQTLLALLAADFGKDSGDPLDGAIDFNRMRNGMRSRKPRHQCYFVDACRSDSEWLTEQHGAAGRPLVASDALGAKNRLQPTYYSTLLDAEAYAPKDDLSFYTRALLDGLAGAGAEREPGGTWKVNTFRLSDALAQLMADSVPNVNVEQLPITDQLTRIILHKHDGTPEVPVSIGWEPKDSTPIELRCLAGDKVVHRTRPTELPWRLRLAAGKTYAFVGKAADNKTRSASEELVMPPIYKIDLK